HATISKLETPVIYFYPGGPEAAGYANVRVDFPEGIVTQWFPQASLSSPRLLQGDAQPPLRGGYMTWDVQLSPEQSSLPSNAVTAAALPRAAPAYSWNFTRQTHSAYVTVNSWDWATSKQVNEREKFIFYRGLGRFT